MLAVVPTRLLKGEVIIFNFKKIFIFFFKINKEGLDSAQGCPNPFSRGARFNYVKLLETRVKIIMT